MNTYYMIGYRYLLDIFTYNNHYYSLSYIDNVLLVTAETTHHKTFWLDWVGSNLFKSKCLITQYFSGLYRKRYRMTAQVFQLMYIYIYITPDALHKLWCCHIHVYLYTRTFYEFCSVLCVGLPRLNLLCRHFTQNESSTLSAEWSICL